MGLRLRVISQSTHIDLGGEAEAAKVELKNIRAEASLISVQPKLQNV